MLYRSVDVSDEAQVRALIDEIYERFGALDGVFHAAGTTRGKSFSAPLSELGTEESEEQFRAKVYGAYSLAKALDGRAIDFCMLFSSNSAVLGGLGFGAYAAANLFLDSFAASESKSGSTRWVSANWDGWLLSDEQAEESCRAYEYGEVCDEATGEHRRIGAYPRKPGGRIGGSVELESSGTTRRVA